MVAPFRSQRDPIDLVACANGQDHPQEPVCGEEPNPTWVLPPQDTHLLSKGNELEFQGGAATNAEGEDRNQGGKNCHHAHDGIAVA
jgi:hypothetical protein